MKLFWRNGLPEASGGSSVLPLPTIPYVSRPSHRSGVSAVPVIKSRNFSEKSTLPSAAPAVIPEKRLRSASAEFLRAESAGFSRDGWTCPGILYWLFYLMFERDRRRRCGSFLRA